MFRRIAIATHPIPENSSFRRLQTPITAHRTNPVIDKMLNKFKITLSASKTTEVNDVRLVISRLSNKSVRNSLAVLVKNRSPDDSSYL